MKTVERQCIAITPAIMDNLIHLPIVRIWLAHLTRSYCPPDKIPYMMVSGAH